MHFVALLVTDERQPVVRTCIEQWLDRGEQLHATDAAYVCLAQWLNTSLYTLDAALARNAADVGLPVTLVA